VLRNHLRVPEAALATTVPYSVRQGSFALRDLPPPPPILAVFLDGETIAIEIRNVGG
jgi:hypothetical protein